MESTQEQRDYLYKLAVSMDASLHQKTDGTIEIVYTEGGKTWLEPCKNYRHVVRFMRHMLKAWYDENTRQLFAINEYLLENEAESMNTVYAARAADLFGDHAMLNQDDTTGY